MENLKINLEQSENGAFEYVSENNVYSLLEGIDSKGFNSDILFIYKEPTFIDDKLIPGEVIGFLYGGFDNNNIDNAKNIIIEYEKRNINEQQD